MGIVVLGMCCLIGFGVGLYQAIFLGAGFGQALLTYITVSLSLAGAVGLAAWAASMVPASSNWQARTSEEELEHWQDWQMEEAIDAGDTSASDEREEFVAPKRRSA